ncbi:thiamine phosphate synthase (TMP-TENI domain) [Campylobacter blaseri]|uniref:Thiamine phosphate synthase n=1 Tax=Campylobacter blaseri TaxID=2042961 RepID=A0A2P8QZ37_9BACT|nr:thiamine phosphate synthase [Campylobacter blaseri]PSM51502.1 thiamine phosphate synthase [Campylobacter blaseri]PSM52951.1 thiamine phosphate synthase [Campylobacter blaseri]QKF86487.1 thiamine phosphate synthase (TMP-TENI domain) [Campylobacter blaseri]
MSNLVVITNLEQSSKDLKEKIYNFCLCGCVVALRLKELSEDEYMKFANEILKHCKGYEKQIFLHNFINVALKLKHKNIWLPLDVLEKNRDILINFNKIVVSVHNINECQKALNFGANILCVSHIFETNCKKDLTPKGLKFIKEAKEKFNVPIYALGGINQSNFKECLNAGANMVCSMSGAMKSKNEKEFASKFI